MIKFLSNLYENLHILQNIYIKNNFFFKKKSYSMDKEDLVVEEYFKNKKKGFYVDVGCYHPLQRSNTMLLYQKGWRGINIDVDHHTIEIFNYLRPKDYNKQIAVSDKSGEVDLYFYHDRSAINTLSKEKIGRAHV